MYRMSSRSVITLIALLTLLALPLVASARGLDRPRPTVSSGEGGWLADVADWFQDVLSLRGREGRHHTTSSPSGFQTKEEDSTNGAAGGPCIDPQGRPKPWCL
jgi:hypothetical protein